jgi:hypothetical protein
MYSNVADDWMRGRGRWGTTLNPFCWQNTHQQWMQLHISSPTPSFPLVAPYHQTLQVCTLLQVPVMLYGNSRILKQFHSHSTPTGTCTFTHTHKKRWWNNLFTTAVLSKASILNCAKLLEWECIKLISYNFSNSALPPVWKKKHAEEVTYSGYNSLQVQAVPGLFPVQFCIHKYNIQQWLRTKQLHIMIHANFLLSEPTCQTALAHPLSGYIPEDLEHSITITSWKEMGVTSSVTRNLGQAKMGRPYWKNGRTITVTCLALAPTWKKWETMLCGKLILSLLWKTENRTYYCGECRWYIHEGIKPRKGHYWKNMNW